MGRSSHRRNAISPVIATVILVVVAITAALITANWVTGITSSNQQAEQLMIMSKNCIYVNDTWIIGIKIKNVGPTIVTIENAYIDDAEVMNYGTTQPGQGKTSTSIPFTGLKLQSGEINNCTICIDGPNGTDRYGSLESGINVNILLHSTHGFNYPVLVELVSETETTVTYVINSENGNGGSISPLGDINVPENSDITFIITPDVGYVVSNVLVDGLSVGTVSTVTFSNVTEDHIISAWFSHSNERVIVDSFAITAPSGSTGGTLSTSESFTVTAQIKLKSGSSTVSATITPPIGYTVTSTNPLSLSVGGTDVAFTWTVKAPLSESASAPISLSASAIGYATDTDSLNVVTVAAALLTSGSSISASPSTLNMGSTITVTMTVHNSGSASAITVSPSSLSLGGTGSAVLASGPTPASANIAGGATQTFTWSYTASSAGTLTFSGSATGSDQYIGTTVSTGLLGPSTAVTVNEPVLDHFVFSTISTPQTAGTAITGITITAVDVNGNIVTSYVGSTIITETGGGVGGTVTQSPVTLTSGTWTGSLTLTKSGTSVTITATGGGKTGVSNTFTVSPGAFSSFTMTGYPTSVTAGTSFGTSNVVVTAKDAYGNTVTGYTGQVYFTSTDAAATLPYTLFSKYTFTVGDAGVHTFAGTGFTLKTAGSKTITVTTGSTSATSNSITVNVGSLDHFTFSTISSPQTAGSAFSITITAKDAGENTITSYTGTNTLSVSSGTISPTSTGAFLAGVRTESITLFAAGSGITINTLGNTKTGTSNSITVNAGSGEIGYHTQGSSSSTIENYIKGDVFTSPAYSVTIQTINAYITVSGGTFTMKAAIYSSSNNLLASTGQVSVTTLNDGWVTFTLTTPYTLTADTDYIFVVWSSSSFSYTANIYYNAISGESYRIDSDNYASSWPTPISWDTLGTNSWYSIYCTYSIP